MMRLRGRGTDEAMADRVVIGLPDSRRTTSRMADTRLTAARDQPHHRIQLERYGHVLDENEGETGAEP